MLGIKHQKGKPNPVVSIEYDLQPLQNNTRHRKEEPQNNDSHETPGRQIKQSSEISLPHQDEGNKALNNKTLVICSSLFTCGRFSMFFFIVEGCLT